MNNNQEDMIKLLTEIRDLLIPISSSFQDEFVGTKLKELEQILTTEIKRGIFSLLFDPKNLSQTDIAKEAKTTQPTVSRLIAMLLDARLIEKNSDGAGKDYYIDKYKLAKIKEIKNGNPTE